ncbi:MAG: glycosyltransferase [Sphingomonas sp.]|uniref:glycosyltransferase n=1 Tax=Sphingomonas sp. TaxID=28214 RepID=UPI001814E65B|nr:glycosyltransferase [Sphingomonas sp.]MBA3666558.1 glycosyltransferase [Sphingomonas sp.]
MSGPAILYVHDLRGSGVVTNAIALARRLGAERKTILVAGYGKGLNRAVDVAPARLAILSDAPEPARARLASARRLRRLIQTSGARLVMSMGNYGHSTVFFATRGMDVHTVYRISNEIGRPGAGFRSFRRRAWQKLLLATADGIVLVGRALAEQPLFAGAVKRGEAAYIPNGIDLKRAAAGAEGPSPHPWLDDGGPPVVLTIGRIHVQKNLDGLVEGAALAAEVRPLRLVIVGSGDAALRDRLTAQADERGLALLFAGETDNVFAWLGRADLFALVSHWEGSSTALLEAIAVGAPVVASRQAGDAAHVLDGGTYGRLVDADDPASIAAGIVAQLDVPIRPGNRAEQFRLYRTHQRYLDVLRALGT